MDEKKELEQMIRVFVGYDPKEAVAFSVLSHSIHVNSSAPVSIAPLMLSQLNGAMWRERNPLQSTDFSFSRFLVPNLCAYEGWSIFMDCDMLMLEDVAKLWALRDEKYAVMCVKHAHQPKEEVKFLNAVQTKYEKKNWSSVILFNNKRCRALTPEYVNTATGLELHQFKWLKDESEIGAIPAEWNLLVGYDAPRENAALVHYTTGGPYFKQWVDCDYSKEWFESRDDMLKCNQVD